MTESALDLSLVVPLNDEEDNVESLVTQSLAAFDRLAIAAELILVDDGSRDRTRERARAVCCDDRVRLIALRRRFGKGVALEAGIRQARGRLVAMIDGDLQEDPSELDRLLDAYEAGAEFVSGWRRERHDAWLKRVQSRCFNFLIRVVTGLRLRDLNCGFKLMSRELAQELRLADGRFRFAALFAHAWGYRVAEVEVSHRARQAGHSSFGSNRFPGVFIDLVAVLCLIRYRSRPGHLFIQLGAISGLAGVVICGFLTYLRLSEGSIGFRYPLLALGVLLILIGTQLVATGFLGEWLAFETRLGTGDAARGRMADALPPTHESSDALDA